MILTFLRKIKSIIDERKKISRIERKFIIETKKFFKNNFKNLKINTNTKNAVISEMNGNFFMAILNIFLVAFVARIKNSKVIFIGYKNEFNQFSFRIIRKRLVKSDFFDFNDLTSNLKYKIQNEAKEIFSKIKSHNDLLNLKYKGIQIGDLIYDMSMRRKELKASVWKIDDSILEEIKIALTSFYSIDIIKNKYKINAIVTSDTIGTEYGVLLRYLNSQKIESYVGHGGTFMIKKYKSYNNGRYDPSYKMPTHLVNKLIKNRKNELLKNANTYLNNRINGNVNNLDAKSAYDEKLLNFKSKGEFCKEYNLIEDKPIVIIMLHSFNDYCNHFNNMLYPDYYSWFIDTLKISKKIKNINWIFKEHPACKYYPHDGNLKGIFSVIDDYQNITFLDNEHKINTAAILKYSNCILTCHGTIGLEAASFGIPSILISDSYYSDFEIGYKCDSIEDYYHQLSNIEKVKPLNESKIEIAKILLYITEHIVINDRKYEIPPYLNRDEQRNPNYDKILEKVLLLINSKRHIEYCKILTDFIKNEDEIILNYIDFPWLKKIKDRM